MRITNSRKRRVEPEGKIIVTYYMTTINSMFVLCTSTQNYGINWEGEEKAKFLSCQGGSQEMIPTTEKSRSWLLISILFRMMELSTKKGKKLNS